MAQPERVQIRFSNFKVWEEKGELVYIFFGQPDLRYKDILIKANVMVGWGKGGKDLPIHEVYAEGNVRLKRGDQHIWADRIYYSLKQDKGIIINFKARGMYKRFKYPVVIRAQEVRQIGRDHFEATNASFTTCTYGEPHLHIGVKDVRLWIKREEGRESFTGTGYGITPVIFGIPFLYLPRLQFTSEEEFPLRSLKLGLSDRFAFYTLGKLSYTVRKGTLDRLGIYKDITPVDDLERWGETSLKLDYRHKRGGAYGVELDYGWGPYSGYLKTYYLRDKGPDPDNSFDRQFLPLIDKDRWRVKLFHRHQIGQDIRGDIELSYISDRNLLPEFFNREWKEWKEQETLLYIRWLKGNRGATFQQRHRLNDFQTQTELLPKIELRLFSEQIPIFGGLPISLWAQLGHLRRLYDKQDWQPSQRTWRWDTMVELAYPFDSGWIQWNPFVIQRFSAFSRDLEGDSSSRLLGTAGIRANLHASRNYPFKGLLNIERIKHIGSLECRYTNTYLSTLDPARLYQFDQIDGLDRFEEVALELHQRLIAYPPKGDKKEALEFLRLSIGLEHYPEPGRDTTSFRWDNFVSPYYWIKLSPSADGRYKRRDYSDAIVGLKFKWRWGELGVTEQYNLEEGNEEFRKSILSASPAEGLQIFATQNLARGVTNAYTYGFRWRLLDKWGLSFFEQRDARLGRVLERRASFRREFHDFYLELIYEKDAGKDESRFYFTLVPKFLALDILALRERF
jgi:hypothetical protein